MAEFHPGVVGGVLPVDLTFLSVGGVPPGGELGAQDLEVADARGQALPGQGGELDLGDVEPRPVLGGVMDLQALGQRVGLGRFEGLLQRGDAVGVEVVHDQHHGLGLGVVDGQQLLDLAGPVDPGPLGQRLHPTPPS